MSDTKREIYIRLLRNLYEAFFSEDAIRDMLELLKEEPERKKGKWIRTRTMEHDGELYCDQCEQEHPEQKIIWNFCPNCGSRNIEEGEQE